MSSRPQIAANRRNAQKSTGPRTPEGRVAVRLVGVKHGLTANSAEEVGEKAEMEEMTNQTQFHSPVKPFNDMQRPTEPAATGPPPIARI
jgi:hypothetical protein